MSAIEVLPVRTRRDIRDFVNAASVVYRSDPAWVPPLRRTVRHTISADRNPFHREALIEHFVARDKAGIVRGRIAATVHAAYIQRYGPRAFFGFFECTPDQEVAAALLGAVETWAARRQMDSVAGPYTYTGTQEMGLLVSGFDQ